MKARELPADPRPGLGSYFFASAPNERSHSDSGSVLILSLLTMTALIVMGVGYLEVAATQAEFRVGENGRYQARCLAESGTEWALQVLEGNPGFTGQLGTVSLGGGTFEAEVTGSGSSGTIVALGEYDGIPAYETTTYQVVTGGGEQIRAGAEVRVHRVSAATWANSLYYSGEWEVDDDSTATGVAVELEQLTEITLDSDAFRDRADHVFYGDQTFAEGATLTGLVWVEGAVTLNSPCNLSGTIFATGDIELTGSAATSISSGAESAVLLSLAKIRLAGSSSLSVVGDIYCLDEFELKDTSAASLTSRVFTNGKFHLHNASGTWFTPVSSSVPPEVGGVSSAEWNTEIVVTSRRPGQP